MGILPITVAGFGGCEAAHLSAAAAAEEESCGFGLWFLKARPAAKSAFDSLEGVGPGG